MGHARQAVVVCDEAGVEAPVRLRLDEHTAVSSGGGAVVGDDEPRPRHAQTSALAHGHPPHVPKRLRLFIMKHVADVVNVAGAVVLHATRDSQPGQQQGAMVVATTT